MKATPKVGVILVNWRGWRDTVLALDTLFGGDYQAFDAIVVDNASGDGSVDHMLAWAQGRERAECPSSLRDKVRLHFGTTLLQHQLLREKDIGGSGRPCRLTIIEAARNGGFAAGNNIALRYLIAQGGYDYFWLLNNDAFPAPDALSQLVARCVADPQIGMAGSTLVYAYKPDTVQALGGAEYRKTHGHALHIGAETRISELPAVRADDIEARMAYVVGASMLVSKVFLQRVGLMEERYFLYFEELDWAERGKPVFKLGYAKQSVVFHKAGGSTQAGSRRSVLAAYYIARSRLIFTRRFHPECTPGVYWATLYDAGRYATKLRWSEARGFVRALLEWPRKSEPGVRT
jgi:hypothetical protein